MFNKITTNGSNFNNFETSHKSFKCGLLGKLTEKGSNVFAPVAEIYTESIHYYIDLGFKSFKLYRS